MPESSGIPLQPLVGSSDLYAVAMPVPLLDHGDIPRKRPRPRSQQNPAAEFFKPPALYCPFSASINPHTAEAHRRTVAWGQSHGLLGSGEIGRQQANEHHTGLVGRTFPHASRERFQLLCDWTCWLFWHDDVCDETTLGQHPTGLGRQFDRLFGILTGTAPPRTDNAFDMALVEMRQRFRALAPDQAWIYRFVTSVQDYFQGCIWEARNREYRKVPSVDDFIPLRRCAGATWIYLNFVEFASNQVLPIEIRENPSVKRLMQITCDIACWHNDLYSLPKELRQGDVHNLVTVLQAELRIPLEDAILRAAQWCDAEVREFQTIVAEFPRLEPSLDSILRSYVLSLASVMRGNLDWAQESSRYKPLSRYELDQRKLPEAVIAQARHLPDEER